jgi:hypothetical protein
MRRCRSVPRLHRRGVRTGLPLLVGAALAEGPAADLWSISCGSAPFQAARRVLVGHGDGRGLASRTLRKSSPSSTSSQRAPSSSSYAGCSPGLLGGWELPSTPVRGAAGSEFTGRSSSRRRRYGAAPNAGCPPLDVQRPERVAGQRVARSARWCCAWGVRTRAGASSGSPAH